MTESKSVALPLGDTPIYYIVGRVMGIEPTTSRTTILRSNQLSYTRHLVRLKGFEPLTLGLEGRCSIQLSYRCIYMPSYQENLERVMGIGPTQPAWKAGILPLNYTRITFPETMLINYTKMSIYCQLFRKGIFKNCRNIFLCAKRKTAIKNSFICQKQNKKIFDIHIFLC